MSKKVTTDRPTQPRLNILLASPYWWKDVTGGVAQMSLTLCRELIKSHAVTMLVNDWAAKSIQEFDSDGIPVVLFRIHGPYNAERPIRGFVGWLLGFPGQLRLLRRLIRERKIDIIQVRYPQPSDYIFRVLRWLGGPPYVVSLHGNDVLRFEEQPAVNRILLNWVLAGAACVSAVSNSLAKEGEETFRHIGPIRAIHNGKPMEVFDRMRAASNKADINDLPRLFFINPANVTWKKGQDVLIRAWSMLPAELNDIHLLIAGEKRDYWDECIQLIGKLGCGDRVHLLDWLEPRELFDAMRRAIGCIMASRHEGFSGVILEAGALQVPLICTDIPSFREIARHRENAFVVALGDPNAIVNAVIEFTENSTLRQRLSKTLYEDVRDKFNAQSMATEYVRLYRDVLGKIAPNEGSS